MHRALRAARNERGQSTLLIVLLVVSMMAGSAIAVDAGSGLAFKERCEYSLEAAALAAASQLPDSAAALAQARQIITANGLDTAKLTLVTPFEGDSRKVHVTYSDHHPTFFGRVFGVSFFAVNSAATAAKGGFAAFDYALFSGSTTEDLYLHGMNLNVTGGVHGNDDLRFRGADITVSGGLEASGVYDARGSTVTAGSIVQGAPILPMPDYPVADLREACATRYSGDQHWSGETIDIDGGIFVDGDLKLSGVTISGNGMLVCTGAIELAGTGLRYAGADDNVVLYALDRIKITGTNFVADGILYAPHGDVFCHGSSLELHGSVVADTIDFGGANVTVVHDADAGAVFIEGKATLTR